MIVFLTIATILLIVTILLITKLIYLFVDKREKKYIDFLWKNSKSLINLNELNKKYKFYRVNYYIERHTYDNEKFFDNISCIDYLIYQLQFYKDKIISEIKRTETNKYYLSKYNFEISKIYKIGEYFTKPHNLNKDHLLDKERKLFHKIIINPIVEFKIEVILSLSNINGHVYRNKRNVFSSEQISNLINRLNNKSGTFYNDKNIWDAICRVERGKVTNKMRFSIYKRDGYKCCYCGRTEDSDYLEIDHIKPIAKGGKSTYDNLQTLCRRCNKLKGDDY